MKIVADENIPFIEKACSDLGDIVLVSGRDINNQIIKDADALLVRSITKVGQELLDNSSVRFVGTATIGFEHIDLQYLAQKGIGFSSAPGSNANSVAEYIVSFMLNIAKKYNLNLQGKSIGIIGVGNVGSKVERKAAALGMKVVCNDPPLQRQTGNEKYRPIEELYDCDFITVHTPLTKQGQDKTFHLCNDQFFDNLKDGAIFINSSRGAVVETQALKNAINNQKLMACGLDVWENEPNIDTELLAIVDTATPHIAGYSYDGKIAGMVMVYEAMCKYLGLSIKHSIKDFLPAPQTPKILLPDIGSYEDKIRYAVNKIYDISKDDSDCRNILCQSEQLQGKFFDNLRKNYWIRREFQNTIVENAGSNIIEKIRGIGFGV